MKKDRKRILLLTLVHPDFLPPVYAIAQVLRDSGYHVHILTFDSFVKGQVDVGDNIEIETIGRHDNSISFYRRQQLRRRFIRRAKAIVHAGTSAIVGFCPFSFLSGLKVKGTLPLAYIALEVANFDPATFMRSPFSNLMNLRALRALKKVNFLATPSPFRSFWLAGRANLNFLPHTIYNTAYVESGKQLPDQQLFRELVPKALWDKKIILYTGSVNASLCVRELVEGFCLLDEPGCALVITGMNNNDYSNAIYEVANASKRKEDIVLLPVLPREQMLALQANAHIGVCLAKEREDFLESKMIAPNKVGEYLARGLFLLGIDTDFMQQFASRDVAVLCKSVTPECIANRIKEAVKKTDEAYYRERIETFVNGFYCMQEQAKPLIHFLKAHS